MKEALAFARHVPLLVVTIVCGAVMGLLWGSYQPVAHWIVTILVAVALVDTLRGMIDDVRHGHVGVDILAVVAILSTLAVKEYWAAWAVVLMVYSGAAIEQYAQSTASSNLTALVAAAPQTAHVIRGGTGHAADYSDGVAKLQDSNWGTVTVDKVHLNDVLVVKPGETVPVDGELISSEATLDLSNINGEPVPRQMVAGSRLMSGAVNGSTTFLMEATQLSRDSQYQRILELVRSAQSSRAAVVRTADLLAVPFTVLAFIIAGVAWIVSGVPTRFAQVLVLATPCPLLIAAPVAYMAGSGRLAKAGVLIKTQDVIENLGRVSHVFFDKTGTLTVKRPRVTRIDKPARPSLGLGEREILAMAGAVETYSVHILSNGITAAGDRARRELQQEARASGDDDALPRFRAEGVAEDSGEGVHGRVNGHRIRVGRFDYVTEAGRSVGSAGSAEHFAELAPDEMAAYVTVDGQLAGRIVMKDVPREDAAQTIAVLRAMGVNRLSMLTGDKMDSARIIADQVGIQDVHAGLYPEGKAQIIAEASRRDPGRQPWWDRWLTRFIGESVTKTITMMVGDGVNDAPVLAAADVGLAITDGSTTAASESAQAVIMKDDIACVPRAIAIARRTKRVMLQAVVVGLGLATLGMLAAAFNLIPVVVGAFAQEAIDVVSILWALSALMDKD
ncbi:heavy metal translocating P-type ATPase [Bifidobacterium xylocopae]|uniref:Heavy metal translocating P-type ATPase n=1 Tax=Bifidobacterium xylocopae TaxID=2493119 RepID=A0A366KD26_9BIFI|nr:heavy metal translocating P-type ATPase [Bifidobacterium xylocopae]RBP99604.1 heavy metal translocating P-type ATPase [Bifidobacterium xylocopae]